MKAYAILFAAQFTSGDWKLQADTFTAHCTITVYAKSEKQAREKCAAIYNGQLSEAFVHAGNMFVEGDGK